MYILYLYIYIYIYEYPSVSLQNCEASMKVFSVVNLNGNHRNINFENIFGDLILTYISSVIYYQLFLGLVHYEY